MVRLAILLMTASSIFAETIDKGRYEYILLQSSPDEGCMVDVFQGFAGRKPPLLLVADDRGEWKLAKPTTRSKYSSYINLADKKILMTCPGKRNTLKLGERAVIEGEATCTNCNGSYHFLVEGQLYQTHNVSCSRRIAPYEFNTGEACSGDGILLKLGYMVNNQIQEIMKTCHRLSDGNTYYSRHILDGSQFPVQRNVKRRSDAEGRPWFSVNNKDLFRGFPPFKYYKQNVQLGVLSLALGADEANRIFNKSDDKFFAKGHLSPRADFLLETWRDATFPFVNVQPQWQEINGGKWGALENVTRRHVAATGKKYEVITGTSGILNLNGMDIFLDPSNKRLPIPEYYTKLVREIESNKCVAFVATNFPHKEDPQPKCINICAQHKWPSSEPSKKPGFLYCCSYEEFQDNFFTSAPEVDCRGGILNYEGSE